MVNTEHIVIGLLCSILPEAAYGCVFNVVLVYGAVFSISLVFLLYVFVFVNRLLSMFGLFISMYHH